MAKNPTLQNRFQQFIQGNPRAEWADDLAELSRVGSERRADFLLDNRSIVGEIKSLEEDPCWKIDEEVTRLQEERGFIVVGRVHLKGIFSNFPDSDELSRRIMRRVTRAIEHALSKANSQIESTKRLLALPQADGVLILLNGDIAILDPGLVRGKVQSLLDEKDGSGLTRYPHVVGVLFLTEKHRVRIIGRSKPLGLIIAKGQFPSFGQTGNALIRLLSEWATHGGPDVHHLRSPQ
ncbi:MAG: hypothetical protein EHM23_21330 [Acidobacteria bacterium]|nr:MAG: hypothetical protein EHM23_21330 [Acidobacteriota bacterium]